MTEEGNAVATEQPVTPSAPEASWMDSKGELKDGWTGLLDEDLREEPYLKEVKNINSMARSTVSARKMVGAEKLIKPLEGSGDEVWEAYWKAGGRPDTANDYGFKRPDDYSEDLYDDEYANQVKEILFKHGASKKLADELFAHNLQYVANLVKTLEGDEQLEKQQLEDALHLDWGLGYEQKKHLGNMAVEQGTNGDEEFKQRLVNKFGNDPDFVRFASNVGGKFAESGAVKTELIPTSGDIQTQIDEAMGHPAYKPDYMQNGFTKAQHDAQVNKVQRLFVQKAKYQKTA